MCQNDYPQNVSGNCSGPELPRIRTDSALSKNISHLVIRLFVVLLSVSFSPYCLSSPRRLSLSLSPLMSRFTFILLSALPDLCTVCVVRCRTRCSTDPLSPATTTYVNVTFSDMGHFSTHTRTHTHTKVSVKWNCVWDCTTWANANALVRLCQVPKTKCALCEGEVHMQIDRQKHRD